MKPYLASMAAAALTATCTAAAFAAPEFEEEELALVYGDKSTVSIATGSQQALRRAPAVASVITAEDIAAMGATDLDEVLESVPGMHVARNAVAYAPSYTIRGIFSANNAQTLMLQNGIPVTTMFTGGKGKWGFAAAVRNLFDADVREPSLAPGLIPNDLPQAPRSLWLQATYQL